MLWISHKCCAGIVCLVKVYCPRFISPDTDISADRRIINFTDMVLLQYYVFHSIAALSTRRVIVRGCTCLLSRALARPAILSGVNTIVALLRRCFFRLYSYRTVLCYLLLYGCLKLGWDNA